MPLEHWNLESNEENGMLKQIKNLPTHWEVSVSFHTEPVAKIFALFIKSKQMGHITPEVKEVAD